MTELIQKQEYGIFLNKLKNEILFAQQQAYQSVNKLGEANGNKRCLIARAGNKQDNKSTYRKGDYHG